MNQYNAARQHAVNVNTDTETETTDSDMVDMDTVMDTAVMATMESIKQFFHWRGKNYVRRGHRTFVKLFKGYFLTQSSINEITTQCSF